MTYEMPIAKRIDYGDVDDFQELGLESGLGSGLFSSGGVAANGVGGRRRYGRHRRSRPSDLLQAGILGVEERGRCQSHHHAGLGNDLPSCRGGRTRSQTLIVSPAVVYVQDVKLLSPGFIAAMNFLDIDAWRDESVEGTFRYRGRWFLMQPLSRPGPKLTDGFYLLPELQPVGTSMRKSSRSGSLPSFGKILAPGRIAYLKPGVGIDPEPNERDYTMEIGFRWFF